MRRLLSPLFLPKTRPMLCQNVFSKVWIHLLFTCVLHARSSTQPAKLSRLKMGWSRFVSLLVSKFQKFQFPNFSSRSMHRVSFSSHCPEKHEVLPARLPITQEGIQSVNLIIFVPVLYQCFLCTLLQSSLKQRCWFVFSKNMRNEKVGLFVLCCIVDVASS